MDKEQADLELRAYLALQGAAGSAGSEGDWRDDVTAALRSSAPLSSEFREALASAIDGRMSKLEYSFRLELKANSGEKKRRQDQFAGILSRRKWMEIGQWVREKIVAGSTRTKALDDARDHRKFASSRETCDAALIYYDRVMAWVGRLEQGEAWRGFTWAGFEKIGLCPEDALVSLFHANDSAGRPPDKA